MRLKLTFPLLLLSTTVLASGPIFQHKDRENQREFQNIYDNLKTITKNTASTVINVKEHGAVGDGKTDDSAAVQAVINSAGPLASNNSTIIYFPRGTYKMAVYVSTADVSLVGDGDQLATVFVPLNNTDFILNYTGGNNDRRFIRGIIFQGASKTGRGIYINGQGFLTLQDLRFHQLEHGIYSNSSEWIHNTEEYFTSNKYAYMAITSNSDILGKGPVTSQNSAAHWFSQVEFWSNTVGFYTDDTDNAVGDHQPAFSFNQSEFLLNGVGAAAKGNELALYSPMSFDYCWFEQNGTSGTVTVNGKTVNNSDIDFSGGSLYINNTLISSKLSLDAKARVIGTNVSFLAPANFSEAVSTDTSAHFTDVLIDQQNGGVLDWAYVDNLQNFNVDRPALAQTHHHANVTFGSGYRNVLSSAATTTGAFGTLPPIVAGSPTLSFVNGDGFFSNNCLKMTGVKNDAIRWTVTVSSSNWYITTFAVRGSTVPPTSISSFTITNNTNVIVPTQRNIRLSPAWRTYASVGQPAGSGTATLDFTLNSGNTMYLSMIQVVEFPSLQEAKNFLNGNDFIAPTTEMSNRQYQSTAAPTSGLWKQGDIVWNSSPTATSAVGFVCTTGGTPGTWSGFASPTVSTSSTGGGAFIWNTNTLQSGATFFVSSGTVSGSLTVGGQLIGKGRTDGTNSCVGCLGEYVSTQSATSASITATGTYQNFLAISLSSGDWDVTGSLVFDPGTGSNLGNFLIAISTFSGNTTTDHITGLNVLNYNANIPTGLLPRVIPRYRINTAANVTAYLKGRVSFTAGTPNFDSGSISARRAD